MSSPPVAHARDDMPRVLMVIANLDRAGAQIGVAALAVELRLLGCFTALCAFRDGPLREELERNHIPVHILADRRATVLVPSRFASEMRRIRRALVDIVKQHRINIVQTHLLRTLDFLVLTLKKEKTVRQIYWVFHNVRWQLKPDDLPTNAWLLGPKRAAVRTLYRSLASQASGLIAVSEQVGNTLKHDLGPLQNRIRVIPNGIDISRFGNGGDRATIRRALGLPDDAVIGMCTARLARQKGHSWFITAANPVLTRFPKLHFVLVGDGPLRKEMTEQVRGTGLEGRVLLLGERTDVSELLAGSDLFVLPSLWEGMSLALLEAMASGLPVIATDVSGTRQVIRDGVDGLLVTPQDRGALQTALIELLTNPVRAKGLGQAARARVESFTIEKRARAYLDLYLAPGRN